MSERPLSVSPGRRSEPRMRIVCGCPGSTACQLALDAGEPAQAVEQLLGASTSPSPPSPSPSRRRSGRRPPGSEARRRLRRLAHVGQQPGWGPRGRRCGRGPAAGAVAGASAGRRRDRRWRGRRGRLRRVRGGAGPQALERSLRRPPPARRARPCRPRSCRPCRSRLGLRLGLGLRRRPRARGLGSAARARGSLGARNRRLRARPALGLPAARRTPRGALVTGPRPWPARTGRCLGTRIVRAACWTASISSVEAAGVARGFGARRPAPSTASGPRSSASSRGRSLSSVKPAPRSAGSTKSTIERR